MSNFSGCLVYMVFHLLNACQNFLKSSLESEILNIIDLNLMCMILVDRGFKWLQFV